MSLRYPVGHLGALATRSVLLLLTPPLLSGCGAKMGDVYGKVVFDGKPVTAGSIIFAPKAPPDQFEAGRPSSGVPNEAGEFQLSTFREHDGALIGQHVVSYLAPQTPETIDPVLYAKRLELHKKFGKLKLPKDYVVEVKPGRNEITLELVSE